MLLGGVVYAPSSSAFGPDACAGTGVIQLSASLPDLPAAPVTAQVAFDVLVGTCALGPQLGANATITGWCGLASGQGTDSHGHSFSLSAVGATLVLTGQLNGVAHVTTGPLCHWGGYFATFALAATGSTCGLHDGHTTVPSPTDPGTPAADVWTCA